MHFKRSYTILGRMRSAEEASQVAATLRSLITEQAGWARSISGLSRKEKKAADPSPLARFAGAEGLRWHREDHRWPQDRPPEVLAIEKQVIIHHEDTFELPRLFGALLYARGGLVEAELQAYLPVVVEFCMIFRARISDRKKARGRTEALARILMAEEGPIQSRLHPALRAKPAWWLPGKPLPFGGALQIATAFGDLIAGCASVAQAALAEGAMLSLKVHELKRPEGDPLALFRAKAPKLARKDRRPRPKKRRIAATLVGVVEAVEMLWQRELCVLPVHFDPRFAVTLRIESARGKYLPFHPGEEGVLAIHSPAMTFFIRDPVGKRFLFRLKGELIEGIPRLWLVSATQK